MSESCPKGSENTPLYTIRYTMHKMRTTDNVEIEKHMNALVNNIMTAVFITIFIISYVVIHKFYTNNMLTHIGICVIVIMCVTIAPFYGWLSYIV